MRAIARSDQERGTACLRAARNHADSTDCHRPGYLRRRQPPRRSVLCAHCARSNCGFRIEKRPIPLLPRSLRSPCRAICPADRPLARRELASRCRRAAITISALRSPSRVVRSSRSALIRAARSASQYSGVSRSLAPGSRLLFPGAAQGRVADAPAALRPDAWRAFTWPQRMIRMARVRLWPGPVAGGRWKREPVANAARWALMCCPMCSPSRRSRSKYMLNH